MNHRRRDLAVLVLSCLFGCLAIPSSAEAGPLLDWLFHRNRSQQLAGGSPTNPLAQNSNPTPTVAGYPPQGSCGPGWCQQTVVQYVPQIAYRTAYQPVPVTTYKTSTTINPANGLPRTCTRPCTSYSYQARRVPYTTYRPVYTTVPVADDLATNGRPANSSQAISPSWQQQAAPAAVQNLLRPQTYTYGYQPNAGCSNCQNGATGLGYGATTPGYTPGNTSVLPPAPQVGSPWSNTPLANPYGGNSLSGGLSSDSPGATPWQPITPQGGTLDYGANGAAGATPWQRVPQGGGATGPGTGVPADVAPSLRPVLPPESSTGGLAPVPIPESMRRRQSNYGDGSSFEPESNTNSSNNGHQTWNDPRSDRGYATTRDGRLFDTPRRSTKSSLGFGQQPLLSPPTNQNPLEEEASPPPRRQFHYDAGAIPDIDRARKKTNSWPSSNDKTALRLNSRRTSRGAKPLLQTDTQPTTRYAAVPIQWSNPNSKDRQGISQYGPRTPSGRASSGEWTPKN